MGRTAKVVRDDQRGGKRLYRFLFDGDMEPVDLYSVTNLCKGFPKDGLVYWAAYGVTDAFLADPKYWVEEVDRWGPDEVRKRLAGSIWGKRDKKADVGTEVHAAIEAHILGEDIPDLTDTAAPYYAQFLRWEKEYAPNWEASELTVANLTARFAGTLDAIAVVEGKRMLLDFKSTREQKGGKPGVYLEQAAQLAAYRHAEIAVDKNTGSVFDMPATEGAAVVWLAPDKYAYVPVRADQDMFRLFRQAAEVWWSTQQADGWFLEDVA